MPAWRTSDDPTQIDPYDIVGKANGISDLMLHALLCDESRSRSNITSVSRISCVHMGPPLGRTNSSRCDAIGSAGLEDAHRRKIRVFLDDRLQERKATKKRLQQLGRRDELRYEYRIHPAATRPTCDLPLWRFSCTGFVLEAYRTARIHLLDSRLPLVSLETLKTMYPQLADTLDDPSVRKSMGIGEGERWPVALVGYVLNSLARDAVDIHDAPYVPRRGDEFFPSQARGIT